MEFAGGAQKPRGISPEASVGHPNLTFWYHLKDSVKLRCDSRCEYCGARWGDQLHHRTYDHWGYESAGEVMYVCRPCHAWIHRDRTGDPRPDGAQGSLLAVGDSGLGDTPTWRLYRARAASNRFGPGRVQDVTHALRRKPGGLVFIPAARAARAPWPETWRPGEYFCVECWTRQRSVPCPHCEEPWLCGPCRDRGASPTCGGCIEAFIAAD
jgi:hypothetical protein